MMYKNVVPTPPVLRISDLAFFMPRLAVPALTLSEAFAPSELIPALLSFPSGGAFPFKVTVNDDFSSS